MYQIGAFRIELTRATSLKALYLLVTAAVAVKFSKWLSRYVHRIRVINKLKGPTMLPIIGNLHILEERKQWLKQLNYYCNLIYKDEPLWRAWIAWNPLVIFHRADALDILLSDAKLIDKSFEYYFLRPWIRDGLLISHGEKWHIRRRMLTPAFHFEILDDYLHVMNEQADILVEKLTKLIAKGKPIDMFKILQLCTLDVMSETAMGQNVNAQNNEESDYVKSVTRISELILARITKPILWSNFIFNMTSYGREQKKIIETLHKFTRRMIMQRAADFEANDFMRTRRRVAFLDILLKAKHDDPTMTFDDVQEEVDTFMFEGNDSTAAAASWACHLLGWNPEVQKKLRDEVDQVFGNTNRALTKDDLKKLEYLECVVKETLRLFPSVPFMGRQVTEDISFGEKFNNFKLEKGETAMIAIYALHRDPKYFPDPERFDPDRFLPENSKDRHPYTYIPFAAGRRNCIGQRFAQMEEKVLLANLIRRFEIKSLKTTNELNPMAEVVTRPLGSMPFELKLRTF